MIVKSSVDKVTSVRYSAAYPTGAERFEKWVSDGVREWVSEGVVKVMEW